jgi:hypothetical protein
MISHRDVSYVAKLAPVAQLLEMLGHLDQPAVRSPEVYLAMAQDVWKTYWYLSARLNDELVGGVASNEQYFEELEQMAGKRLG